MEKKYEIKSSRSEEIYEVEVVIKRDGMRIKCSCPAGQTNTLCKHVIEVIGENEEIQLELEKAGHLEIYKEYIMKNAEMEKLKLEVRNLKMKMARALRKRR